MPRTGPIAARRKDGRAASTSHPRRLVAILVVGAVLRLTLLIDARHRLAGLVTLDSAEYVDLAKHFTKAYRGGQGPLVDLGLSRTPVYPAFLSLVFHLSGDSVFWAMVVQIVVALVTIWVTYRLARAITGSETAALSAAALLAVDPLAISFTDLVGPEVLFALLLVAAVWFWWSSMRQRADGGTPGSPVSFSPWGRRPDPSGCTSSRSSSS